MMILRICTLTLLLTAPALAQHSHDSHAMDGGVQSHAILDQFEGRVGAQPNGFRWHGQAWIGTDTDKLWLKSEGTVYGTGQIDDGRHELFYNRALSTYFDLQLGFRTDQDSGTGRSWAAAGLRGVLPYFIETEATLYASDNGHYAARLAASYDLRLTQKLILQPQIDVNLYSRADPGRHIGAGLSSIDAGLRLRYEIVPEFAPYIGVVYGGRLGQTARLAAQDGDPATQIRFVFGIRSWF